FAYQFAVNFTYTRHITLPSQLLASSSTQPVAVTPDIFGLTDLGILNPTSSTIDTASWVPYTNNELGFSLQYPKDLIINTGTPGTLILAVPKDSYFHWPLLDDAKISI